MNEIVEQDQSIRDKAEDNKYRNIKIITIAVVIVLWSLNFVFLNIIDSFEIYHEDFNTIGDSFGLINSLFSGLAFALLILTSYMQRKELELQRKELRDTRAEFREQNITMRHQRFENTLFNMINNYHKDRNILTISADVLDKSIKVDGIHYVGSNMSYTVEEYIGQDAFKKFSVSLIERFNKLQIQGDIIPIIMNDFIPYLLELKYLYVYVSKVLDIIQNFKYFNESDFKEEDTDERYTHVMMLNFLYASKYLEVFRAHLSQNELLTYFYLFEAMSDESKNKIGLLNHKFFEVIEPEDILNEHLRLKFLEQFKNEHNTKSIFEDRLMNHSTYLKYVP